MSGDVKDQGGEGASLTAADLDRLAYEWSERRVVMNGIEFAEKADRARLERLKTALPSILALARRGLEAEAEAGIHVVLARAACESAESKLAAALAEVERVRGRLEKATYFSWRNSAVWIVRPEDSTLWHAYEEVGSCGAALIGKFDTLDAAWSAAEAQAGQAAKQGGEGRT